MNNSAMPSPQERESALFALALEKPVAERAAFLQAVCGADGALRQRLETLLAAHEQPNELLGDDAPPAEGAAPTMKIEFAEEPADEIIGQKIGRYKLLERVGEGGCGVVYVAEQTEPVRRRVALKVIKLGMDTKQVVARFEAERQALAMMDHPNIAKVLDAGTTDVGRPFFVMELVRGIRITEYCDQAQLSTKERLDLFIKVCQAIQHAHQKGIIHRDIKPSNILVTLHDGVPVPKVIDFGIAKATEGRLTDATVYTQLHQFIGTPAYMSPEQAEMSGLDIDTRSDIYSLGVLLYELLAGSTPFDAKELMASGIDAMRKTIREKEPVRPSTRLATLKGEDLTTTAKRRSAEAPKLIHLLKGDLDWIVMKCLEKDRTRRYDTANGLAADLKRHLSNEPVVARPPSAGYRLQKSFRRNKLVFTAAMAVATALVFGIFVSGWQAVRATHAEREQKLLRESAERARAGAEAARVGETTQRLAAETAQASETKLRKLAQVQAYAADMKAAQAALQQNSRQQAVTLLDQYWPKPGEPDLRGVEWRYLWQAAKGDEIYSWKHPGMVPGAKFSPDGRQVVTACFDGMLRIYDIASGRLVAQFDRGVRDDYVRVSFCYSPDGATLASAARDGIVLLDCATWQVKKKLELSKAERDGINNVSLTYSPDGQSLAAGVSPKLRIWKTGNWESITLPTGPSRRIAVSPDSKNLTLFSSGGGIDSWDLATGAKVNFADSNKLTWELERFSPAGDQLFAADVTGIVNMWDVRSRTVIWSERAHRSRIYGLAVSHDGKRFATGGFDQLIHIWDAATREKVMTLQGHLNEIWSLEFSPDDRYLLTSSKDGTVKLWDAQTKPPPDNWMLAPGEWPVGFTLDGRGFFSIADNGRTLRKWNGRQEVKSLSTPTLFVNDLTTFSAGSQSLFSLNLDGEVQIFDANTLELKRSFKLSAPCNLLYQASPDGRYVAARGVTPGDLYVWDVVSGKPIGHMTDTEIPGSRDMAVFSPDNRVLAFANGEGRVSLWDVATRRILWTLEPHPWVLHAICFSADSRYVASSSWAGDIRISDVSTGEKVLGSLYGHGSGVSTLGFSPIGETLVSGGDDPSVRFWNVATGREMLIFKDAYNLYARLPFLSPTGELLMYRDFGQNLRVRVESIPTLAEIEKARGAENTAR